MGTKKKDWFGSRMSRGGEVTIKPYLRDNVAAITLSQTTKQTIFALVDGNRDWRNVVECGRLVTDVFEFSKAIEFRVSSFEFLVGRPQNDGVCLGPERTNSFEMDDRKTT
jgi:hypothetical protein